MKGNRALTLAATAVMLLAACTDGKLMHCYLPTDDEGWGRTDTLCFPLPDIPQTGEYPVSVGLRHGNRFPYTGLWVEAETRLSHPTAVRRDTLYIPITDTNGHPLQPGVSLHQHEVPLTTLHLQRGQKGNIRLHHIMMREVVPAISDVGLRISLP
ncbi:MAG: gliding motility lipoprotein GldH [Bacteroidaceae bacterium]|nr:gliding motility lipoprotein GldH [Bacteroidaceae bacterium]